MKSHTYEGSLDDAQNYSNVAIKAGKNYKTNEVGRKVVYRAT